MPTEDVQRLFEEIRKLPVEKKLDLAAALVRADNLSLAAQVAHLASLELGARLPSRAG